MIKLLKTKTLEAVERERERERERTSLFNIKTIYLVTDKMELYRNNYVVESKRYTAFVNAVFIIFIICIIEQKRFVKFNKLE